MQDLTLDCSRDPRLLVTLDCSCSTARLGDAPDPGDSPVMPGLQDRKLAFLRLRVVQVDVAHFWRLRWLLRRFCGRVGCGGLDHRLAVNRLLQHHRADRYRG